jgi:hypothetical protein
MSESMIERVARAICRANGRDPDRLEPGDAPGIDGQLPNGDPAHFVWKHYMDEARAAIEAMRSPTRDVLTAFVDADVDTFVAGVRWEAAIDAALTPSPASK